MDEDDIAALRKEVDGKKRMRAIQMSESHKLWRAKQSIEYHAARSKTATEAHREWLSKQSPEVIETRKVRLREWERTNRKRMTVHKHKQRHKRKAELVALMGGKCMDCGGVFPPTVYEFHHTDPNNKTQIIAEMYQHKMERLLKEVEGCVMICANCHRIRHAYERAC